MRELQKNTVDHLAHKISSDVFTHSDVKLLLVEIAKTHISYDCRNLKDLCSSLAKNSLPSKLTNMIEHFALSVQFQETRLRNVEPLNIPLYLYKYINYQKNTCLDAEYKSALGISKSSAIDKINKHIKQDKKYPDTYFIKAKNGVDQIVNFLLHSAYTSRELYMIESIIDELEKNLVQLKFLNTDFSQEVKDKVATDILFILSQTQYKSTNDFIQSAECFIDPHVETDDNSSYLALSLDCVFISKRNPAQQIPLIRRNAILSRIDSKVYASDTIQA